MSKYVAFSTLIEATVDLRQECGSRPKKNKTLPPIIWRLSVLLLTGGNSETIMRLN